MRFCAPDLSLSTLNRPEHIDKKRFATDYPTSIDAFTKLHGRVRIQRLNVFKSRITYFAADYKL